MGEDVRRKRGEQRVNQRRTVAETGLGEEGAYVGAPGVVGESRMVAAGPIDPGHHVPQFTEIAAGMRDGLSVCPTLR